MTQDEIKQYRASIEGQLKDKETDIETTITYVTLGLLGLFLTINEKFIPLKNSNYKLVLLISVLSFVLSFLLGLINKFKTTKYDREIIDIIDNSDLTKSEDEQILLKKWQDSDTNLQNTRKGIYIFLVLGLIAQLFYFFLNVNSATKDEGSLKIEIQSSSFDTIINKSKTNIHIYQTNDSLK